MPPPVWRVLTGAAVVLTLGGSAPQSESSTVVLGRVVEGLSDVGVPDALVRVRGMTAPYFAASALTTDNGDFVFVDLPAGSYSMEASRSGYVFGEFGQRRPAGRGRTLIVPADGHLGNVRVPVWKSAAISGLVLDDSGEPVTGISVQAMSAQASGGRLRISAPYKSAQTDDRGAFRLSGVLPGAFVLSIPAAELASLAPRSSRSNPSGEPAYLPVFFPPGVLASSAATLAVTSGEERTGINLRLQLAHTRRVSGHITGTGDPPGILVRLTRLTDGFLEDPVFAEATTGQDGGFGFDRVIPGEYVASVFEPSGAPPTSGALRSVEDSPASALPRPPRDSGVFGTATVVVSDRDVDNVEIILRRAVRISGQVVFIGNAAKPRLSSLALYLQPELANGRRISPRTRGTVDSDFRFRTGEVLPGRYFLRWPADALPDWAIESITVNGVDAMDRPITAGDSDVDGVVVTLTDRVSEVTGVVRTANGTPDLDVAVIVFPVDSAQWSDYGFDSPRLRYVRVNLNGTYTIRALPPGDYLAVAMDDALTETWQTRSFFERWSRVASRFTVAAGATRTLDLRTAQAR